MKFSNRDRLRKKIAALPKVARDEMHKALKVSAEEMEDLARRSAPIDDGALKASIGYTFGEYRPENSNVRGVTSGGGHDLSVTIHAGDARAYYAAFVEHGTQAHIIQASEGGALGPGGVFGEKVNHPGARAEPFFYPSYRLTKKRAKARLARAVRTAAKKVAAGRV